MPPGPSDFIYDQLFGFIVLITIVRISTDYGGSSMDLEVEVLSILVMNEIKNLLLIVNWNNTGTDF